MEDTGQEKTEQATPRKLEKAREEGQVARSMELNSVVIVTLGLGALYVLGPALGGHLMGGMRKAFSEAPTTVINAGNIHQFITNQMGQFAILLGPILLVLAILAYMVNVAQVGVLFSAKPLEPKPDKLSITKGFKRVISKRSLVELIRDLIKTTLVSIVAYQTISGWLPSMMASGDTSVGAITATLGRLSLLLTLKIAIVLFIIAAFDFAFQRFDMFSNLRMTRQEVREELKETEGNPLTKARVRQIQREMARKRMMSEIPQADVVVTNPTHIAVALKYDPAAMPAPLVLAKGQRLIAEKIKEIALAHKIPIVENKPLARSLFKLVDVGAYIPATLYRATAEVLAYIYRLKEKKGVIGG
jgi:flagellar biosynthetic protein FlhB